MNSTALSQWLETQIGDGKPFASNREFARQAGVSENTIRRMRDGHYPSLQTIKKMAKKLNYPLEDLLSDKTELKDDAIRRIEIVTAQLPPEDQDDILDFALRLLRRRQRS